MRYPAFLVSLAAHLRDERGDAFAQFAWSLGLLVVIAGLALLAGRYVAPEWWDSVDIPPWLR